MKLGERIRFLREEAGMTQTALADAAGTTKQSIYKYETGIVTNIPSDKVEAIAVALQTTPAYLMGWEEEISDLEKSGLSLNDIADEMCISVEIIKQICAREGIGSVEAMQKFLKVSEALRKECGKNSPPLDMVPYKPTGQVPILGTIPAGMACLAVEDIEGYISVDVKNPEECFALRVKGDSMINAGISPGDLVIVRTQNYADNGQIVACRINGDESTLKRFTKQGDTVVLMPENPQYPVQIVKASDFENGSASIIGVALQAVKML